MNAFRYVLGVVFVGAALMNIVAPQLLWKAQSWQYKNRQAFEPSKAGYLAHRIFGVIALCIGIPVFFVLPMK